MLFVFRLLHWRRFNFAFQWRNRANWYNISTSTDSPDTSIPHQRLRQKCSDLINYRFLKVPLAPRPKKVPKRPQSKLGNSPVLSSVCHKSAQLSYFEKVQHSQEKSRAKNLFAEEIRAEAKVHLCEKGFGDYWRFKRNYSFTHHKSKCNHYNWISIYVKKLFY